MLSVHILKGEEVHSAVSIDGYCVSIMYYDSVHDHWVFEFGPLLRPNVATTLTNLLLYCSRLLARPVFFFFFSCLSTYNPTKYNCSLCCPNYIRPVSPRRRSVLVTNV